MALQSNWLSSFPSTLSILRLWIVFALNPETVFSVTTPMNTTVFVGERFTLHCSINKTDTSFIDWSFFPDARLNYSKYTQPCPRSSSEERQCTNIVSNRRILPPQNERYTLVNEANGTHYTSTLSVESVNSSYAGVYQCVDDFGSTAFSFLTVIDPNPTCSWTVHSNNTLNCSFAYFGITPQFQWSSNNSRELINCTQKGNNYVICVFKHPLISKDQYASCRFEEAIGAKSKGTELRNLTLQISYRSLVWHLLCKVRDTSTTSSGVDESTTNSVDPVIVSVAVISGVVALAIFIVVLLLKCESRRKKEKSNLKMSSQTMVEELSHSEDDDDDAGPVYSEVNRNKSRRKAPIYSEVKSRAGKKTNNGVLHQDPVIAETGIYGYASYDDNRDADSERSKRARENSPRDCNVIYSELQRLEPTADGTKGPPLFSIREGFDRSEYVSVDHSFRTPPAPPAPPRTHR